MGQGKAEGWGIRPRLVWYCLAPSPPHPAWRGKLSHPISTPWGLAPPGKTLFLLIFPTTSTIFFNETYFIDKNIFEITTKFIQSNQINF